MKWIRRLKRSLYESRNTVSIATDHVEMKKPHACQTNFWEIILYGDDILAQVITVVKWSLCQDGNWEEDEKVTVVAAEETNKERVWQMALIESSAY